MPRAQDVPVAIPPHVTTAYRLRPFPPQVGKLRDVGPKILTQISDSSRDDSQRRRDRVPQQTSAGLRVRPASRRARRGNEEAVESHGRRALKLEL